MKLHISTIVLDGMPFLTQHLPEFEKLNAFCEWTWHVVEGAAMNNGSTRWCKPQQPRLSRDGSSEYLNSIAKHPNVRLYRKQRWNSKDEMCNAPLAAIKEPCVLMQIDHDEMWRSDQLAEIVRMFYLSKYHDAHDHAFFFCRYFVGPGIVITSKNTYGNKPGEWKRAWRFKHGMRFTSHEPPVMDGARFWPITREETFDRGLVFNHYAYVTPEQVAYKERFYGYKNALKHWQALQAHTIWPVSDLRQFLPWVGPGVTADLIK